MKKLIAALFFALMFVAVGSVYADVLDDNPQRYHAQGTNSDGNESFIAKTTIRHNDGNLTTYTGILRLSNRSDLFSKARTLVTSSQIPLYVLSVITVDCEGARLKTGKIAIVGVDTTDDEQTVKVLWADATMSTDWSVIPNGIESRAKALLCGPSF